MEPGSGGTRGPHRREVLALGAAGGAGLAFPAPAVAQRARALRFGHMMPADTGYGRAIQRFADEVAKLSSNRLKVDVYPSSQLGSIPEMISATRAGSLTMTMAVPAWYSTIVRPFDLFALPYLVRSSETLREKLDGRIGREVEALGAKAGLQVVGYWLIGSRNIANRIRPVLTPADCAGLKLRVPNSQVFIQAFRSLGASAVAMDTSELYLALQQGVVDGYEYGLPDLVAVKLYEVSKYLSLDSHAIDFFLVSMNKAAWDGLPPEDRDLLKAAMKTAMDQQWREQPEEIEAATAKLRSLMQVADFSPAQKEAFAAAMTPIWAQFEDAIGKNLLDLAKAEFQAG